MFPQSEMSRKGGIEYMFETQTFFAEKLDTAQNLTKSHILRG
jgi:hypothetical protein